MNLTKKHLSAILKKELKLSVEISDSLVDEFFQAIKMTLRSKRILSFRDLAHLKHIQQKKEWVEIQRVWKITRFHLEIRFVLVQPQKLNIF